MALCHHPLVRPEDVPLCPFHCPDVRGFTELPAHAISRFQSKIKLLNAQNSKAIEIQKQHIGRREALKYTPISWWGNHRIKPRKRLHDPLLLLLIAQQHNLPNLFSAHPNFHGFSALLSPQEPPGREPSLSVSIWYSDTRSALEDNPKAEI